ncbi:MAG: pitrilysin family protein, partial [Elusimicrobiaceae bacterium]
MRFTQFILAALLLAVPAAQATPPRLTEPAPLKLAVPEGQKFTLGNGLTVILLEDHRIPVVRAYALVKAGSLYDSPDKIGTADMMADALRSAGTGNYPSAMFNEKLDFTGATINSGMESEYGNAEMFALAKDAPQTLAMFADMLINPAFEQEKVEILRNQFLESISRRNDNPQDIAYRESRRMFYGADNPYGWRAESGTISAVTVADLKNYHDNYYKPDGVILAVTGDFDTNNMLTTVKQLFGG